MERTLRAEGTVATIVFPPSARGPEYAMPLRWAEVLELGRMLMGEITPRPQSVIDDYTESERAAYFAEYRNHAALVIWSIVNRQYYLSRGLPSMYRFINHLRAFSQPINPEWRRGGLHCRPGGDAFGRPSCSDHYLRSRAADARRSWSRVHPLVQQAVLDFLAGNLANPDPRAMNFAVYSPGMCSGRNDGLHDDIDPRVVQRIWTHGFCGTADPRGYNIRLVPGAWARAWH